MPKVGDKIWYIDRNGNKRKESIKNANFSIAKGFHEYLMLVDQDGHYKSIVGGIIRKVKKPRRVWWINEIHFLNNVNNVAVVRTTPPENPEGWICMKESHSWKRDKK